MKIYNEAASDFPIIADINKLAFARENEAKLVECIRNSNYYIPELSLIAKIEDNIVGHILFSYIDIIGDERLRVLALAPIAVHPKFQRQLVGSTLIKTGLEKASAMEEALVLVLGNPSFYHRFGFVSSINYEIKSPFELPDEYFMVKVLKNYQPKYKGKVVYPPAFNQV
jgi:putative acetyltransferase